LNLLGGAGGYVINSYRYQEKRVGSTAK